MANDPFIGRQLANFRVERLLGRGGMAQVYFGHDIRLQRPVAIKVIDARYRSDVSYAERFVREARTVATWRHENILQVYYADEEDGLYYYVMEYIDGPDLAQLLAGYSSEGALMPHEDVITIGRAVARALDYAHTRGVIHRDVKPSNVMVASDGRVVLADFGLAMDVEQGSLGEIFGTPHYIAPEQARRSADAIPQSDLYSMGVMLYEMLTGVVPFDDPSPTSLALQHLTLPPPPPREINPDLSAETETVLLKALSKSPDERYPTGGALMDALEQGLRVPKAPDARRELPPPPAEVQDELPDLSRTSVSDRVARYVQTTQTPAAYPEPIVPATRHRQLSDQPARAPARPAPRRRSARRVLGAVLVMAAITAAVFFVFLADEDEPVSEPLPTATIVAAGPVPSTESPTAAPTDTPVNTSTPLPSLTPTETPSPTATPQPTLTSTTVPPTATANPTATPTATLTLTPLPASATSASPSGALAPTVLYPNGRHFALYYDSSALYLHNLSGDKSEVNPFAFERLDAAGNPSNRFDGWRWAQFYSYVFPQACARILLGDSPVLLRPPQCERYNSEVWAERGMSLDFWTEQAGSSQFRVLWNDQEVARCPVGTATCEVWVP